MKAGMIVFVLAAILLGGGLLLVRRAADAPAALEPTEAAANGAPAAPGGEVELARGETEERRTAELAPREAPALEAEDAPEDDVRLADLAPMQDYAGPPPESPSADQAAARDADFVAKYGTMPETELRRAFTELESLLQASDAATDKSAVLEPSQADAIRREVAWVKERLYP